MIANTLNISVAQRLIRLLCNHCKTRGPLVKRDLPSGFNPKYIPEVQYKATGCDHCHFTGYQGRKAIYEVLPIDSDLCQLIKTGSLSENHVFQSKNILSLATRAFELMSQGKTSLEEIYPLLLNSNR